MTLFNRKIVLPTAAQSLPGRTQPIVTADRHWLNGNPIREPLPDHLQRALFGMGCFWGAERKFWQQPGVFSTCVGYAGGHTPNPNYEEVCSGLTGHAEVVCVIFNPEMVDYRNLLRLFWEHHNPTQGMRQGNDIGTQYRSVIYTFNDQQQAQALASRAIYQACINQAGQGKISTEIAPAPVFYYAEDHHQQYLAKNPLGYCGLGGLGIAFVDCIDTASCNQTS